MPMLLLASIPGALPREIGDEIWQESLTEAIEAEAEATVARTHVSQLFRRGPRAASTS